MDTAIPETGVVLIVEDQAFVAMAATTLLTQSRPGLTAVVCATAQQTMDALSIEPERFYRILLDLDVPGAHRLSLAMHIKELGLQDRCCIVTAHNRSDLAGELKELGFLGYVLKSMPIDEFAAAMRLIFLGQQVFVPLDGHAETPGALRLTRRQAQVLDLVRHGQNSKQIASALALSVGRVDNIISATLDVLGATSRTHAVSKAVALGLISAPDDSDWDNPTLLK